MQYTVEYIVLIIILEQAHFYESESWFAGELMWFKYTICYAVNELKYVKPGV